MICATMDNKFYAMPMLQVLVDDKDILQQTSNHFKQKDASLKDFRKDLFFR